MRYYYLPLAAASTLRDLQWGDPTMMDASATGGWKEEPKWDAGPATAGAWEDPTAMGPAASNDPCDKKMFQMQMDDMRKYGMTEADIKMMWGDFDRMCSGSAAGGAAMTGGTGGMGPADMNCDPKWAEQQM